MRLVVWVDLSGARRVVAVGHLVLHQPVLYLVSRCALVFVFVLINGISLGISDSNPISSAFVVVGRDPGGDRPAGSRPSA